MYILIQPASACNSNNIFTAKRSPTTLNASHSNSCIHRFATPFYLISPHRAVTLLVQHLILTPYLASNFFSSCSPVFFYFHSFVYFLVFVLPRFSFRVELLCGILVAWQRFRYYKNDINCRHFLFALVWLGWFGWFYAAISLQK